MARYPRIKPTIDDPYPGEFKQVTDFQYLSRLVLAREAEVLLMRRKANVSYILHKDYTVAYKVDGRQKSLTVPRGLLTDLTSVPWGARNIVGKVGPHLEAAIVHDFLYIAWQLFDGREARKADFRFANAVMFAGLEAADVGWVQRHAIKLALTFPLFSWSIYRDRNDGPNDNGLFVDLDNPLPDQA